MIIAVEGVDCAGKGEVCPRLAAALQGVLYQTPPKSMRNEQNRVNAEATDAEHYRYFVQVVKTASEELAALSASGPVVVDRYWMTTVVYHRVMGVSAKLEDFGEIVMPDLTVYLTVSAEVQSARMAGRGMSPGDKRMDGRQHLIRQMYDDVIAIQSNVIRVDTSNITPEQVVDLVVFQMSLVRNG